MKLRILAVLWILALTTLPATGEAPDPRVLLKTELGDLVLEVFEKRAPVTAANFLDYVDRGLFEGACFYRVVRMDNQPQSPVKIEVIQAGLQCVPGAKTLPAIAHETTDKTGVLHKDGTVSMARLAPGSASSEFFICINDQPELDFGGRRNPDGQGFAAFGRVVEGMDVARRIQQLPADGQYLVRPLAILSVERLGPSAARKGSHR